MNALLRQGASQQLLTRLAARVFTTSSHVEAAAPAAASVTKTALNKEFQIYRFHARPPLLSSAVTRPRVCTGDYKCVLYLQMGPRQRWEAVLPEL